MKFFRSTYANRYRKQTALLFLFLSTVIFSVAGLDSPVPVAGKLARFSLLTASPGNKVWANYGHTGIRYVDPETKTDVVFNYGFFDFSTPHFIPRFIAGQTDYLVGTTSIYDFILEYQLENRAVTEQVLNLNQAEKNRLWKSLLTNIKPENRIYRYNFFFNNCATKPRDVIEQSIDGTIVHLSKTPYKTLREVLHHYTQTHPWTQFGIDFAIGAEADKPADLRTQQFAPEILMNTLTTAVIHSDSLPDRPLFSKTINQVEVDASLIDKPGNVPTPMAVMWSLFGLTVLLTIWGKVKKKKLLVFDAILFGLTGIVGFIMYYLMFFSVHPATHTNYLAIWIHPLHLLFALSLLIPAFRKKGADWYKLIQIPLFVFSLAGILFLPQVWNPATYPLILMLLVRSLTGLNALKPVSHE